MVVRNVNRDVQNHTGIESLKIRFDFVRLNVEGRFLFCSAVGQPLCEEMIICANPAQHRDMNMEV